MKRTAPWRSATAGLLILPGVIHGWVLPCAHHGFVRPRLSASGSYDHLPHNSVASRRKAVLACRNQRIGRGDSVQMQVWSNPQAVKDYQNLLGGTAPEEKQDGPSVIIGKGKLGSALADMGSGQDVVLGRGDVIPQEIPSSFTGDDHNMLQEFPIYVCVPEDAVASIIDECPPEKRDDLVFLQSGCLEPLLKSRGLCRNEQTQATLFLAVDKVGTRPKEFLTNIGTDTRGDAKLAGETAACGKWRGALAMRLENSPFNLHCARVFYLDWRRVMFEKLIFECAVGLVGALHKSKSVGFITKYHAEEVADMLFELKNTLRGTLAVTLMNGYPERLLAYGEQVGDSRDTGVDEKRFEWYHKFFYDISQMGIKKGFGDPCPMHTEYLEYGRDEGIFNFQF